MLRNEDPRENQADIAREGTDDPWDPKGHPTGDALPIKGMKILYLHCLDTGQDEDWKIITDIPGTLGQEFNFELVS